MRIFESGTAPQASALGYYLNKLVHSNDADLKTQHENQDLIFVRGATVAGQQATFEFAMFKPVLRYTVGSALACPDWTKKATDMGLRVTTERLPFTDRWHFVEDANCNCVRLVQSARRGAGLDVSDFHEGQRAIVMKLLDIGLLTAVLPKGRQHVQSPGGTGLPVAV